MKRGINSALFALVPPTYFLPFITFLALNTCGQDPGQKVHATFTGWDLVSSSSLVVGAATIGHDQATAIVPLVVAALGATLSWLGSWKGPMLAVFLGFAGAFLMAFIPFQFGFDEQTEVGPGFLLAAGFFLAAGAGASTGSSRCGGHDGREMDQLTLIHRGSRHSVPTCSMRTPRSVRTWGRSARPRSTS